MFRAITSISFLLILCLSFYANAQDAERHFTLPNTHYIQLHSSQTGHDHELIISLPDGYAANPNKKYPVLYFLDAYWDQPLLTSTYGNLMYDRMAPEFIMVGFSYPGAANYGEERLRDFTPTVEAGRKTTSGKGAAFLQFIKETVVPLIEKQYRVDPQQRALSGSSLGGLFAIYAMYQQPDFFTRYIAISPAAGWDDSYLSKLDSKYSKNHKTLNARLFISYGTAEYKPFAQPIAALQKQIKKRGYKGLALQNYKMQGLRHTGVKGEGYARGLIWAWKDITPVGPSGLELEIRVE
jgi:uncharacterized protein